MDIGELAAELGKGLAIVHLRAMLDTRDIDVVLGLSPTPKTSKLSSLEDFMTENLFVSAPPTTLKLSHSPTAESNCGFSTLTELARLSSTKPALKQRWFHCGTTSPIFRDQSEHRTSTLRTRGT